MNFTNLQKLAKQLKIKKYTTFKKKDIEVLRKLVLEKKFGKHPVINEIIENKEVIEEIKQDIEHIEEIQQVIDEVVVEIATENITNNPTIQEHLELMPTSERKNIDYIFNLLKKQNRGSFKQLGNNAMALTKDYFNNILLPNITKYTVTDKADGERAFLIAKDIQQTYFTATDEVDIKEPIDFDGVFDCELIGNTLYIFDVLEWNGRNVSTLPFEKRLNIIKDINETEFIKTKKYSTLTKNNYKDIINNIYNENRPYKIDGLIFTEFGNNYRNTKNLKWKPENQLTIDFLVIDGVLNVGINRRMWNEVRNLFSKNYDNGENYFPVPFITSFGDFSKWNHPEYNGKIVELSWNDGNWIFHRIRADRQRELATKTYFGNFYKVAKETMELALNPLTLADLTKIQTPLNVQATEFVPYPSTGFPPSPIPQEPAYDPNSPSYLPFVNINTIERIPKLKIRNKNDISNTIQSIQIQDIPAQIADVEMKIQQLLGVQN